jgi:uncharacterized heparinase superfamily protein
MVDADHLKASFNQLARRRQAAATAEVEDTCSGRE